MRPSRSLTSAMIIGWSLVTAIWAHSPGQQGLAVDPLRLLVVGGFLLIAPGWAAVRLLRLNDRLLAWSAATGVSLVTLILAAQLALYTGNWSPPTVVGAIAVLTALMAVAGAVPRSQSAVSGPAAAARGSAGVRAPEAGRL